MADRTAHASNPNQQPPGVEALLPSETNRTRYGYKPHPAAELFPMMDGQAFKELCADIHQHGLRHPIVLHEGMVLDGRNRLKACEVTGVPARFTPYEGYTSPTAYVLSANLYRRHLDTSQRGMLAARAKPLFEEEARKRQIALAGTRKGQGEHLPPNLAEGQGDSRDLAATVANVSHGIVDAGSKVLASGTPELVAAVDRGEVKVSAAAEVATLPPEEQRAAVAAGKVAERAKQVREGRKASRGTARASTQPAPSARPPALVALDNAPDEDALDRAYTTASKAGLSSADCEAAGDVYRERKAEFRDLRAPEPPTNPGEPPCENNSPAAWASLIRQVYELGDVELSDRLTAELTELFRRGCAMEFAFEAPATRIFGALSNDLSRCLTKPQAT